MKTKNLETIIKTGIYKITNKVNGKIYIGQSINIHKRWGEHRRAVNNKNSHTYNYPLYRAMRKYGFENFSFEILEECPSKNDILTQREQYYIDYYNTLDPNYGYNQENAVDSKKGELSNFSILKEEQVRNIRALIKETTLTFTQIAKMYSVSSSAIEDINKGKNWADDEWKYPIRNNAKSIAHQGERQNTAILTTADVLVIRNRYVEENLPKIFEDYKNKISFAGFKKICYGATWKHLPVYKKREQKWILP